ncbi:hypothetical protein WA158_007772 [Blastocystis sp. Blastoise]
MNPYIKSNSYAYDTFTDIYPFFDSLVGDDSYDKLYSGQYGSNCDHNYFAQLYPSNSSPFLSQSLSTQYDYYSGNSLSSFPKSFNEMTNSNYLYTNNDSTNIIMSKDQSHEKSLSNSISHSFSDIPSLLSSKSLWKSKYQVDPYSTRHSTPPYIKQKITKHKSTDIIMPLFNFNQEQSSYNENIYYVVEFKHSSNEYRGPISNIDIHIGDYVYIYGDRGINIGHVIASKEMYDNDKKIRDIILNKVEKNQYYLIEKQREDEKKALKYCCELVEKMKLEMIVLDAEFQYDRKKLTFYYQSTHRIDFKNLIRELYCKYNGRIWMEKC